MCLPRPRPLHVELKVYGLFAGTPPLGRSSGSIRPSSEPTFVSEKNSGWEGIYVTKTNESCIVPDTDDDDGDGGPLTQAGFAEIYSPRALNRLKRDNNPDLRKSSTRYDIIRAP